MATNLHSSYFKYTPLTTADSANAFEQDLSRQYEIMRNMTRLLPGKHKNSVANASFTYGNRIYPPDAEAFNTGFSMVLSILQRIEQMIRETDDTLSSLIDEGDDEEEILHATGELFAAKTIYINLVASIEPLEYSRLRGTEEGIGPDEYFRLVQKVGDIPEIEPRAYANGGYLNTARMPQGSISNISASSLYPNNVFLKKPSVSPSVSATPPAVPLLP